VHTGKGGSVSVKEGIPMSEEALVNTSAVCWPDLESAERTVRRMQTKLHRWAGENSSRRFGDLFNLVYDPAFLVCAWDRVSTNKGAQTAGRRQAHGGPGGSVDRGRDISGPHPGLVERMGSVPTVGHTTRSPKFIISLPVLVIISGYWSVISKPVSMKSRTRL
jgi:hypothetical protein